MQAILPPQLALDAQDLRLFRTEEQDNEAKYYVLNVVRETGRRDLQPLEQLWIERSGMAVAKKVTFAENGKISGVVRYSNFANVDGATLPQAYVIDRPLDGYRVKLEVSDWHVNRDLSDKFVLEQPPGSELINLKEKAKLDER